MRGSNVVIDGIFVGSGVALALWVDLGFFFVKESSVSWRFPLAFQIIFSVIAIVFITMLPESPRWLIKKGRVDEGRQVLAALLDVEEHSDVVNDGVYDIESSLSHCGTGSWKDMFTNGEQRLFHRTYLAATGQMFQQMCGINVITFYATTIFEQYLGMSPVNSRIIAAAMPLTQPFGGWLAYYTIDRLGRRPLLIWSAAALAVCMAGLAGTTSPSAANNTAALAMAVVFLYCFQFIATIGYAGLTFLYAAEIAPLQIRAAVNAVSTATVWSFNFLLAVITPVGFATIGSHFYIIFAVINALMVPSVYLFFPETKDRSLEEIDEIFAQSKNVFDPPRVARAMQRKMRTVHIGEVRESGDIVEIKSDGLQMDVKA
jgi:MFS family permease